MLLKVWMLYRLASIKLDVLLRQYLNGHIIHRIHLTLQYNGIEQGVNACIALLVSMLSNEERDTALTNTCLILRHHIVAHDLNIATITLLQELTHNMCFRIKGDAMVDMRMILEEFLKDGVIFHTLLIERQIYFCDFDIREVVYHIMTETCFTVCLLF